MSEKGNYRYRIFKNNCWEWRNWYKGNLGTRKQERNNWKLKILREETRPAQTAGQGLGKWIQNLEGCHEMWSFFVGQRVQIEFLSYFNRLNHNRGRSKGMLCACDGDCSTLFVCLNVILKPCLSFVFKRTTKFGPPFNWKILDPQAMIELNSTQL